MSETRKNCRRCSRPIEETKSCGEKNCPHWNPRDLNKPMIKRDLKLDLPDKYFVENLCNSCSDKLEDVLNAFLEVAKEKIIEGESLNFKGYFTIKRSVAEQKGSKNCDEHQKELDKFKQANKGKGIAAYTKSEVFRNLVAKTRNCTKCKVKKQQLAKNAKLTNRISFKPSKDF